MIQLKARWVLLGVTTLCIGGAMLPIVGRYDNQVVRTDPLPVMRIEMARTTCSAPMGGRRNGPRKCFEKREIVLREPGGDRMAFDVTTRCLASRAAPLRIGETVPAVLYRHKAFGRSWTWYDHAAAARAVCGGSTPERLSIARWMMRSDEKEHMASCAMGRTPRDGISCGATEETYGALYYEQVMPKRILPPSLPFPSPGFVDLTISDRTREQVREPSPKTPQSADVIFVDDTGTPEDKVVHLRRLDQHDYLNEGPSSVYVPAGTTVRGRMISGSRYAVTAMAGTAWKGQGVHFGREGVSVDMGQMQVAPDGSTRIGLGVDGNTPPRVIPNERF